MATDAERMPAKTSGGAPKRRIRNFLLDPGFQLKYTGMVVAVTVLIAAGLGYGVYAYSQEMTNMLTAQRGDAQEMGVSDELQRQFEADAQAEDMKVLLSIIGGILLLAVALGLTGIVVTHKVVGPAFKLKLMLGDIEHGSLKVRGGFRKGDELQDVGDAFKRMVNSLRKQREEELADLDAAIERADKASIDGAVLGDLRKLRERLKRALEA